MPKLKKLKIAFAAMKESAASIVESDASYDEQVGLLEESLEQFESYLTKIITDDATAPREQESDMQSDIITKDEVYEAIKSRALAQKRPSDSEAQAISRWLQEDPEAR